MDIQRFVPFQFEEPFSEPVIGECHIEGMPLISNVNGRIFVVSKETGRYIDLMSASLRNSFNDRLWGDTRKALKVGFRNPLSNHS